MSLPDPPRGKFKWIRPPSHGWCERVLQRTFASFITAFEFDHPWVTPGSGEIEERFTDTGVHVRTPNGPTGPEQRKDNFLQRDGIPLVIVRVRRARDGKKFEVALPCVGGNDVNGAYLIALLRSAREALTVAERDAR